MGREASGTCSWGTRSGRVTLHLDSVELTVRGDIRARIARDAIGSPRVAGDRLVFEVAGETVTFDLDDGTAKRWAAALVASPPSLARKLGITPATRLHVAGAIDDDALSAALALGGPRASLGDADLAIVRTDDARALGAFVAGVPAATPPIWIVYAKGRSAPLGERAVRDTMRAGGFTDTKVASVSDRLTALRFSR